MTTTDSSILAALLRALADAVESGDQSRLTQALAVLTGGAAATPAQPAPPPAAPPLLSRPPAPKAKGKAAPPTETGDELRQRFCAFATRDELRAHLRSVYKTKPLLAAVAAALNIPMPKSAKVDVVVDAIVDETLGHKLTTAAIRGS